MQSLLWGFSVFLHVDICLLAEKAGTNANCADPFQVLQHAGTDQAKHCFSYRIQQT